MDDLIAKFTLEDNQQFDAVFRIDSGIEVVGEGNIKATTFGGVVTITSQTFVFEQGVASDTWEIEHNLNKHPSVTLVDSAGTQFVAQVEYNDMNNCTVYLNGATKGRAYLN